MGVSKNQVRDGMILAISTLAKTKYYCYKSYLTNFQYLNLIK